MSSKSIIFTQEQIRHRISSIHEADEAETATFPSSDLEVTNSNPKIEYPTVPQEVFNKINAFNPVAVCRVNDRLCFITNMQAHMTGISWTNQTFHR
jgi:NRPS condensation-like uncharacterized protein